MSHPPASHQRARRRLLKAGLAMAASGSALAAWGAEQPEWRTLGQILPLLDQFDHQAGFGVREGWPLPKVLVHCAQSIDYSLDGYPEARSRLFQATAGSAAFAVFRLRGKMSHPLDEPIPGAPAIDDATSLPEATARLRRAIARFQSHQGPLAPHFAYGALEHADFELAHVMHIANHLSLLVSPAA
ncbi:DUF1569 domain-containing protein [Chitinivorax sp. PXF-14]|uniref:DUF1569 domain-containing protein n=1 Tax=Chitinivorax sp. PXF-14 TaxID=3230488 RepID=UPI003464F76F